MLFMGADAQPLPPAAENRTDSDFCKRTVAARSLLCYWANRAFGLTTVELARRLKLAQPTISQAVERGERIAAEKRLVLLSKTMGVPLPILIVFCSEPDAWSDSL